MVVRGNGGREKGGGGMGMGVEARVGERRKKDQMN